MCAAAASSPSSSELAARARAPERLPPASLTGAGPDLLAVRVQKTRIQIWLYENADTRIEGRIVVRCKPYRPRSRTAPSPYAPRPPLRAGV